MVSTTTTTTVADSSRTTGSRNGPFLDTPNAPNARALDRLGRLLRLAEAERLYLDVTGLGCYHKKDVPAWYDRLSEKFLDGSKKVAAGWVGFYWGKPPEDLRRSKEIRDALMLGWLELFQKKAK